MPQILSDYARRLSDIVLGELKSYGGVPETDKRLYDRIYKTYLADLKAAAPHANGGWAMPANIGAWAWSATFVSWCVLKAGASFAEFDLSIRHWAYINRAVQNAAAGTGVFRARKLADYAPQVGDLICANREGGKITYQDAEADQQYMAHTAIVVDLITKNGVRYAVTVGGNEGQTVGRKEVALTSAGLIKQKATDPYICVIQTLKTETGGSFLESHTTAKLVPSALPAAFRKHGTFIYDTAKTVADYGSIPNLVSAMQRAGMSHAWVRIHGQAVDGPSTKALNRSLIAALQAGGIAVAGWGWCQGATPKPDAVMALKELKSYGLTDYVADIEPGHHNSQWTIDEIQTFCQTVRSGLSGGFAVSSFALIDWHEPQLLEAALPYIDAFAPQIYWFNYPNGKMAQQFRRPNGQAYGVNSPADYADLCLDRWTRLMQGSPKPLILTGQAYWGEAAFTQSQAETKLSDFLRAWSGYGQVAGVNWWHFGGGEGMSHAMLEAITAADLGGKTYG